MPTCWQLVISSDSRDCAPCHGHKDRSAAVVPVYYCTYHRRHSYYFCLTATGNTICQGLMIRSHRWECREETSKDCFPFLKKPLIFPLLQVISFVWNSASAFISNSVTTVTSNISLWEPVEVVFYFWEYLQVYILYTRQMLKPGRRHFIHFLAEWMLLQCSFQ